MKVAEQKQNGAMGKSRDVVRAADPLLLDAGRSHWLPFLTALGPTRIGVLCHRKTPDTNPQHGRGTLTPLPRPPPSLSLQLLDL